MKDHLRIYILLCLFVLLLIAAGLTYNAVRPKKSAACTHSNHVTAATGDANFTLDDAICASGH